MSLVALAGCTSPAANPGGGAAGPALRAAARGALDAIRDRAVVRWLALLQLADLGLDVLHAFLALYFVDVMGATPAAAVMAIVVWTAAGLIGDALVIPLLDRTSGTGWVRTSAAATLVVYPAFLLVDAGGGKLVLLGLLGLLNSGWYAVLQARLYAGLPGRSGTVMALTSAAGIAGAVLPLVIALASERWGLAAAMWLLLAGPLALVVGVPSTPRGAARRSSPPRGRASSTP